jgi:hypothetical protein
MSSRRAIEPNLNDAGRTTTNAARPDNEKECTC